MGKVETYTRNRVEGLKWALDLIRKEESLEKGVEMLEKEVAFRQANFIPLEIPADKIKECSAMLAVRLMNALLIVFLKLCEEDFDFRKVRLQRVVEQFYKHTTELFDSDPYGERYVQISELAEYYKNEYGIDFTGEFMDDRVRIEEEYEDRRLRKVQFEVIERNLKNSYPDALEHLRKVLGFKTADAAEKDINSQMEITDYPGVVPEGVMNNGKA